MSAEDTSVTIYTAAPFWLRVAFMRRICTTAIVHILLLPWVVFYLLRHRVSPVIFAGINPHTPNAHDPAESKYQIFERLAASSLNAASILKTILVTPRQTVPERIAAVEYFLASQHIAYPLVAKPDKGTRSVGAFRIENENGLRWLLSTMKTEYIVQEYVQKPIEAGLYFAHSPRPDMPNLYGIAVKHHVYGETAAPHPKLTSLHTRFLCADLTPQLTPALRAYIEHIADVVPFNMGRIDTLAESVDELLHQPERLVILEINTGGPDVVDLHITDLHHSFATQFALSKQNLRYALALGEKHYHDTRTRITSTQFAARYVRYGLFLASTKRHYRA